VVTDPGDRDEVSVEIDAPPQRVWDLVTDVTQMGRWSPECTGGRWIDGSTGPAVGARFKGTNRHGPMRWTTSCTVKISDPAEHFAWEVDQSKMRWGYRFEPTGSGGTRVTEYRERIAPIGWPVKLFLGAGILGRDRDRIVVDGMRQTLEKVKAAAEA
jgi:uncharacterized protein YndB with AHSA1/START domain